MTPKNQTAISSKTSDAQQAEINTDFGISFLKALTLDQNNSASSIVLSPLFVLFVLSQLNLGAKNKTAEEIAKIFGRGITVEEIAKYYGSIIANFPKMEQEQHANNTPEAATNENVNGPFLLPEFQRISERCFGDDCFRSWITKADVSSNNPENLAMKIRTNGYSSVGLTYLGDAKEKPFFLSEGNSKMIDQIHCKEKIGYFEDNQVKVIRFGVKGRVGVNCFGVILPKGHFALDNLLQSIDGKTIRKWMKSAANKTKVEVRLPKFKTESIHRNLDRALKSFGLETMFESNAADFSGMSSERVWVESVIQKASFKLDGKKMEPDTLQNVGWPDLFTGCVIECVDALIPAKQFIADYPFLYVLIDKNDNLLSVGVFRGN